MDKVNSKLEYMTIRNTSVVESVKDWIVDQLIKGNLMPGSKLPTEAELCANMCASRNSVREAIKQLEAYGVVYIKRAEGTFVTDRFEPKMLSPILYNFILQNNRWEDFVDLRRAIDIGTLYVLIEKHPTLEQLAGVQQALTNLEAAISRDKLSVQEINEMDCAFHSAVTELTNNPQLKTLYEYINRLTVPSREKTTELVIASGEINSYIRLHRQIYDIICQGNKEVIEQAVLEHYVYWERYNN